MIGKKSINTVNYISESSIKSQNCITHHSPQPNSSEIENPLKQSFCPSQIYFLRMQREGYPPGIQQLSVDPVVHTITSVNQIQ